MDTDRNQALSAEDVSAYVCTISPSTNHGSHHDVADEKPNEGNNSSSPAAALPSGGDQPRDKMPWYRSKMLTVCIWILLTEAMERLTFYTIQGSQRNFLQSFGYSNAQSTSLNSAFNVMCYLWPLVGGWMADAKLGKYRVILYGGITYACGTILTAISSDPNIRLLPLYFIGTFGFIAAGTGAIKPCVSNFGGDQYDVHDPNEQKEQESFFNWFYLSINVSAAVAFGYLVTLATNGSGAIPAEWGFTAAYSIAAAAMSIAVIAFVLGSKKYVIKLPGGDVLAGLCSYVFQASRASFKGLMSLIGWILLIMFLFLAVAEAFISNEDIADAVSYAALGIAVVSNALLIVSHTNNKHLEGLEENSWLTTEEAMGALDVVPILIVVNVSFSIIYNLMSAAFVAQACQMNLQLPGGGQLNGGFFNIADCLSILVFVPVFEWLVFPVVRRMKGGVGITRSEKLVAGLLFSIAGVMSAVALEYARAASPDTGVVSNCAPDGVTMSGLSGFWMMAPFAIVGIGEVLVNPVLYYFAYNQTPVRTRSMMQAFNLLAQGAISNAYTAALTTAMSGWFTDNLNNGNLPYFYFVNAAIGAMGIPLFFIVSRYYHDKDWESCDDKEATGANCGGSSAAIAISSLQLSTFRSAMSR